MRCRHVGRGASWRGRRARESGRQGSAHERQRRGCRRVASGGGWGCIVSVVATRHRRETAGEEREADERRTGRSSRRVLLRKNLVRRLVAEELLRETQRVSRRPCSPHSPPPSALTPIDPPLRVCALRRNVPARRCSRRSTCCSSCSVRRTPCAACSRCRVARTAAR